MLGRHLGGLEPYVPTLLRLVVGITFFLHGLPKLQNLAIPIGIVERLGVPAPEVVGVFIAVLETAGGLLLILGLGTRLVSLLFAGEMIVTTLLVKSRVGFIAPPGEGTGAELDVLLLACALALVVLGSGALSIERSILKREI